MADNGNVDGAQPFDRENDRQAQNTTRPPARPGPTDAAPTTVALTQRAPTAPIPTRTWIMKLGFQDFLYLHYKHILGQKNHCIRSQTGAVKLSLSAGPNAAAMEGITAESVRFPYPPSYDSLFIDGERQRDAKDLDTTWAWDFGLGLIAGEIWRKWEITPREVYYKPLYLVMGIFPRGHPNPTER